MWCFKDWRSLIVAASALMLLAGAATEELTADMLKERVASGEDAWLVHFFTPGNKPAQRLAKQLDVAADKIRDIVRIGSINCQSAQNSASLTDSPKLAKRCAQGSVLVAYSFNARGKLQKKEYKKEATAKAITKFATSLLPDGLVTQLSAAKGVSVLHKEHIDEFVARQSGMPRVLFFTSKPKVSLLLKALALAFRGRILVAQVAPTEIKLRERFGAEPPAVILLNSAKSPRPSSARPVRFGGRTARRELQDFIEEHALSRLNRRADVHRQGAAKTEKVRVKPEKHTSKSKKNAPTEKTQKTASAKSSKEQGSEKRPKQNAKRTNTKGAAQGKTEQVFSKSPKNVTNRSATYQPKHEL